jgi:hypothetical protein
MSDERQDEKRQDDRPSQQREETTKAEPGTTALSTSDPAIKSSEVLGAAPESAVSYQTSHVSIPPNPYPFEAGGDVVQERASRERRDGDKVGQQDHGEEDKGKRRQNDEKRDEGQTKEQNNEQGTKKRQNGQQGGREHGSQRESEHRRGGERSRKKEKRHAQAASAVNWKTLVMSAVLALVCGVGGAWGYSAFFGPSKSDKQASNKQDSDKGDKGDSGSKSGGGKSGGSGSGKSGSGGSSGEGGASASEIPGFSSAKDADTFRKELEHLSHRLDLLAGRIDQMTPPETQTPPGLHTLQEKVNELESEVDRVANLPHRFDRLQQKLSSTNEELKMLKERVSGEEMPIGSEVSPAGPELAPFVANRTDAVGAAHVTGTANPADEATLKLAIGLFREGHYSQAYDVLRRLQRERPQDARIWYYSALANGMATGDWSGKTKRLAEQGLACEKDGRPSRNDIDAALADLPSGRGEAWLAEQRQTVKSR